MAINRQVHGAPGPWTRARAAPPDQVSRKHWPSRPAYRPHLWLTDLRSLGQWDGSWVSSSCLIAGYARRIVAGMASPQHDLTAVLQMLDAARLAYGGPQASGSDNGSVLTANDSLAMLRDLESEPMHLEKGKPWQNLIEPQCKVQLRLAACTFEPAKT